MRRSPPLLLGLLLAACARGEEPPSPAPDKGDLPKADLPGDEGRVVESVADVERLVGEVRAASYPELADEEIVVDTIVTDGSYSMRARPSIESLLTPFAPITYRVEVNQNLFADAVDRLPELSLAAARSVVAHELAHIADYVSGGFGAIIDAAWTQLYGEAEIRGERRTDIDTVVRGYAGGLVVYRNWLYPQLDLATLARKQEVYLTPPEIVFLATNPAVDEALIDAWMADPPRSLEEMREEADAHGRGESVPDDVVVCELGEFGCFDGSCVPGSFQCDDKYDCGAGEDEVGCWSDCADGDLQCQSGECLPRLFYCDGAGDCADGSDEADCAGSP